MSASVHRSEPCAGAADAHDARLAGSVSVFWSFRCAADARDARMKASV